MECPYVFAEYLCHNRSQHTSKESNNYDYSCQYQNLPLGPVRLHSNWFHYGHVSVIEQLIIAMNSLKSPTITTKVASIKTFHPCSRLHSNWFHFGHVSVDYRCELKSAIIMTIEDSIKFRYLTSTSSVWFHFP